MFLVTCPACSYYQAVTADTRGCCECGAYIRPAYRDAVRASAGLPPYDEARRQVIADALAAL